MNGWQTDLLLYVHKKPVLVIQFSELEWSTLEDSERGFSEFTIARYHHVFNKVSIPSLCLLVGDRSKSGIYLGVIATKSPISTLETRVRFKNVYQIRPYTKPLLFQLLNKNNASQKIESRLEGNATSLLTPSLSEALIEGLLTIEGNNSILQQLFEALTQAKRFVSSKALQEDAIKTALNIFKLKIGQKPENIFIHRDKDTALGNVIPITEDSVIEHDARVVGGFNLVDSDITGRAVFESKGRFLEVYTANRRPLESVFGVDLIYLNVTKECVVMLQYKMLEPQRDERGKITDWIFRPNDQLTAEINRMKKFNAEREAGPFEYRFNDEVFYLKFVKRDGAITDGGIVLPLTHYEVISRDPAFRGAKGGLKVNYNSLSGRYLRPSGFIDLMSSGYIGAHAKATEGFKILIETVINGGRSVVAAMETDYSSR